MKTKFAYVVCKRDEKENDLINLDTLISNFKCEKIINLSKKIPSKEENFSDIKIQSLKRLKKDFDPFMLGMYDLFEMGNHSVNLYMFSDDATASGKLNLQSSLNVIKYEKNYFIDFSLDKNDIKELLDVRDLIVWFLKSSGNLNIFRKEWTDVSDKYQNILSDEDITFITKNLKLDDSETRKKNDSVRAKLRERMLGMLQNGWK